MQHAATRSKGFTKAIKELRAYKDVPPNWNGYGGSPPNAKSVEECVGFICCLFRVNHSILCAPKTMLYPDGEVGIYWEQAPDYYIEVSFRGESVYGFLVCIGDTSTELENVPLHESPIALLQHMPQVLKDALKLVMRTNPA